MVNYPALFSPGVGPIELGVALKEFFYKLVSLTGLLEFLIESECQELGGPYLHTLGFLFLDHGNNVRLECGEEARRHFKFQIQLRHCSRHEIVVTSSV